MHLASVRVFVLRPSWASTIFGAVRGKKWWLLGIGVAYFLFYLGGSYSFSYTHVCARSHKKTVYEPTHNNVVPHTITVCDAYSGNTKHWSPGDPVRALRSERINKWNGAILVVIVLAIGTGVFFDRRKQSRSDPAR
jgi:hypothetical protein